MNQITTYQKPVCRSPSVIPECRTKYKISDVATVVAMPEDEFSYCKECCVKPKCTHCKHSEDICGFPVTFKLEPITVSPVYEGDPEDGDAYGKWYMETHRVPRVEWYCGDKPEDYEATLLTFEQRYDSIITWLAKEGYTFNPNAKLKLNKPTGYPATFQNLLEELHNWLLYNRGHTGVDDWIIAISKINYGAPLKFIGSFVGNEHSGLIGRICELNALRNELPTKVKVSEAKKLGYSKSQLLQAGYIEKQFKGKRFMVKS